MKSSRTGKSQLRGWQSEAFKLYQESLTSGQQSALWEATPGAGKTIAALEVIRHQLHTSRADHALIIVPTSHLRGQWAQSASRMGLHLDSTLGAGKALIKSEFHGTVVTYQQLSRRERWFRDFASRSVVILDEVHHAGDGLTWGTTLRSILADARYILCLSGTAFRSDSNAIPFVHYDPDGVSTPDYSYSYARAVQEGVCRASAFFTYGGEISWSENDRVLTATFSDSLDRGASARRLRASLDPDAGWIEPMIRDAHEMLIATRRDHPQAGALIVCADQTHARQMAKLVTSISGEKPTVVLSDDNAASRKIKSYAQSSSMWLVACNMVSEGVDIPRLRIGVYSTTIRTKMYFRQFLGRIVRRESAVSGAQAAYVYLPADPLLHQFAEEIEGETKHSLFNKSESAFDDDDQERPVKKDFEIQSSWAALQAVNSGIDAVIVQGNQLNFFGATTAQPEFREAIEREVAINLEENLTKSEVKSRLASDIKRLVGLFHRRSGKPHSAIHTHLNSAQSVKSQTYCSERQLEDRVKLLEKMLRAP